MMTYNMIIGGKVATTQKSFNVYDPADESLVAACPEADIALVDTAIASARLALPGWAASALEDSDRPNHSEIKRLKTGADLSSVRPTPSVRPRKTRPVWTSR